MEPGKSSPHDKKRKEQMLAFVQQLAPEADPAAIRLGGLLHRIGHALYQFSESSLAEAGLSFAQYRILLDLLFCEQIEGTGQLNPSEISERQGISRNTVSSLIGNLEEQGLIERRLDREDRRRFIIALTDDGRETVRAHAAHHLHAVGDCFQMLTDREKETLGTLLMKLGQHPAINLTGVK